MLVYKLSILLPRRLQSNVLKLLCKPVFLNDFFYISNSVDLVQTQIKVAGGKTLTELGLDQESIKTNG